MGGALCLLGVKADDSQSISTCLGYGSVAGWLLVVVGAILPCCYTCCFIFLGEGGRSFLGLKSTNIIPE